MSRTEEVLLYLPIPKSLWGAPGTIVYPVREKSTCLDVHVGV